MKEAMRYLLPENRTLLVSGPATVVVSRGKLKVFGVTLGVGSKFHVNAGRQLPLEAENPETQLKIILEHAAGIEELTGTTIPRSWMLVTERIVGNDSSKVLVFGPTDVGKNALCTLLINASLKRRVPVCVIDADVGQAEIGPPTSIAMGIPRRPILTLSEIKPYASIFVGDTTPSRVRDRLIDGVERLNALSENRFTVINTDGWILGEEAVAFKGELIQAIKPDIVLLVGPTGTLQNLVADSKVRCQHVAASRSVAVRSRRQRMELRRIGYRRFLRGAVARTYPIRKLNMKPSAQPDWKSFTLMKHLIVGLLDSSRFMMQIGIILDLNSDSVRIYSRCRFNPDSVEVGKIRLSMDGAELDSPAANQSD
jgi:polynucleotide 5'-hydroxyl-kinase GRC3/NOL9